MQDFPSRDVSLANQADYLPGFDLDILALAQPHEKLYD